MNLLADLTAGSQAQLMYNYASEIGFTDKGKDSWQWCVDAGLLDDNHMFLIQCYRGENLL